MAEARIRVSRMRNVAIAGWNSRSLMAPGKAFQPARQVLRDFCMTAFHGLDPGELALEGGCEFDRRPPQTGEAFGKTFGRHRLHLRSNTGTPNWRRPCLSTALP